MAGYAEPERVLRSLTPTPSAEPPALFHPWPDDVKERCKELWSTLGNRSAGRVEYLYGREVPQGTAIPAASTIRMWAREDAWEEWANADLATSQGKTLHQLQVGWLRALQLSQDVQLDILAGMYDDNPAAAAVKAKVAESVQRVIAHAGLLAVLPAEPEPSGEQKRQLSLQERSRRMRETIEAENRDR